ncbi:MAG: methyl-accepting chemotaxis protein [Desulfobulbaceae bacterium]|nr:methyl-accepting chemotaxis protein [Desulfobulbaceae bacterium]
MLQHHGITAKFISLVSLLTLLLIAGLVTQISIIARNAQLDQADSFVGLIKAEQAQEETLLQSDLKRKGESLGALMANAAAGLIVGYDFASLEKLVQSAVADPDVIAVVFYGKDGTPLTQKPENIGNAETLTQDIQFEGESIGRVEISLSLASVQENIAGITKRIQDVLDKNRLDMEASNRHTILVSILATVGGVLLLCLVIYFSLAKLIVKPVNCIILGLNKGSMEMVTASAQISAVSNQLSDGVAQEAASIEETSASLEEISTMTRQNAENASQADNIIKDANQVVGVANQTMTELTGSMVEITQASEKTSKIIKTIDEIAFQTNLLALNAAVEAARAGEAGAGFAVVADEVRNLAMRAAEAAKDTAILIEGTVTKVQSGSNLVNKTSEAFTEVADRTAKAGSIVAEITVASQEQSQGIAQVNRAMGDIDKVTQHTAMNAEEAADAAKKMNDQAKDIEKLVEQLVLLVNGSKGQTTGGKISYAGIPKDTDCRFRAAVGKLTGKTADAAPAAPRTLAPPAPPKKDAPKAAPTKAAAPKDVIPFDEEEFQDF